MEEIMKGQKMKTKKIITMVFGSIILASVFFIAGCGSESKSGADSTAPVVDDGLPPDPGEAGKATIAGIDSDGDGVRDDIQRYIAQTYPDSEKARAVLTQYAKIIQKQILDADSKELSMQHADEGGRVMDCGDYLLDIDVYGKMSDELDAVTLNTDERTKAYFKYDSQLGGEVFSGLPDDERASGCDFDSDLLAN